MVKFIQKGIIREGSCETSTAVTVVCLFYCLICNINANLGRRKLSCGHVCCCCQIFHLINLEDEVFTFALRGGGVHVHVMSVF